jgi:hypothetical protein
MSLEPDDDQSLVAAVLASRRETSAPGDFVARVNARIDETAGWLGIADFRAWTLGLVPAAAAVVLVAIFWPGPGTTPSQPTTLTMQGIREDFSPASVADWQQEISADALLDAAMHRATGDTRVR